MISIAQTGYALFLSLALLLLAYTTGYLLDKILGKLSRRTIENSIFWRSFCGLFFIVGLYATIVTKGLSILLPLLFFVPFILTKISPEQHSSQRKKQGMYFALVCVGVQFLLYLFFINYAGEDYLKYIKGDFNIYYRNAETLNFTGVETNGFILGQRLRGDVSAYHYGDLWFYALAAKCTPPNPAVTFLAAFTVLSFVFSMGLYQFAVQRFGQYFSDKNPLLYLLILGGLFTGFGLFFPTFIMPSAEPYVLSVFNWGKVLVLGCTLIALVLALEKNKTNLLCLITIVAGLLYINAIPSIFSSVFLILLVRKIRNELSWSQFFKSVALFAGVPILFLGLFYKLVPRAFHIPLAVSEGSLDLSYFSKGIYFKTTFNIFVGGWFQLFTLLPYLLVLLIGLFIVSRTIKGHVAALWRSDVVLFLVFIFAAGLLSWAALHPVAVDTVQFFHNILAPLYAIAITYIFLFIVFVVRRKILSAAIVIMLIASVVLCSDSKDLFYVGSFPKKEWKALNEFFKPEGERANFVNIQSLNNYNYWSSKNADQYVPLVIASHRFRRYENIALMTPFLNIDSTHMYYKEEVKTIRSTSFTKYFLAQRAKGPSNAEDIMMNFIREYKATYLCVTHDTSCPAFLRPIIVDSIDLAYANMFIYKLKY